MTLKRRAPKHITYVLIMMQIMHDALEHMNLSSFFVYIVRE